MNTALIICFFFLTEEKSFNPEILFNFLGDSKTVLNFEILLL